MIKILLMLSRFTFMLIFTFCILVSPVFGGNDNVGTYGAIIMFPGAPNPTTGRCLIRTYLPDSDPNSSLRILDKDSTLVKEIPLAGQIGITSTPLNVSDWKEGTYIYQLFYKGETRCTKSLTIKH